MPADEPVRIAMWSGPRNISTAMMRSFENRPDCVVVDEPLYGHFLRVTGIAHPGRDEVLANVDTDGERVMQDLLSSPQETRIEAEYIKKKVKLYYNYCLSFYK